MKITKYTHACVRVSAGETFTAAGFSISAVGGRHAFRSDGQPDCANLGYVVDDRLYHPGDSLHVPEQLIETLLVPVHGSWMKIAEAVDFVRAIRPRRSFPIHDGQLNDRGLATIKSLSARDGGDDFDYRSLAPFEVL